MKFFFRFCALLLTINNLVYSQKSLQTFTAQPYGIVDTADLRMTSCDFEPDANAEILFDKGIISFESGLSMERHIRIKIFNDHGKENANIRFLYHAEFLKGKGISNLEAETINLENNSIVFTPIDKSEIYYEKINKDLSAIVFAFPKVKSGSIIEYRFNTYAPRVWFFQSNLPTRYSEVQAKNRSLSAINSIDAMVYLKQPLALDFYNNKLSKRTMALTNVHSLSDEPYTASLHTNLQRIEFLGQTFFNLPFNSWNWISSQLINNDGFGTKLTNHFKDEEIIFKRINEIKNDEERIAFLFDTVKTLMKWNNKTFFVAKQDITDAWEKKVGNSAEINLILYHLLKDIGINASPMVVCTKDYGRIDPEIPDQFSLNNTVVFIPINPQKYYVLDASNKFNLYNTIPNNILNSYGLSIDFAKAKYNLIDIKDVEPVIQKVFVNGIIETMGIVTGTTQIQSDSYNKIAALKKYDALGEEKYIDTLFRTNNSIKISSFQIKDMFVDTLPLTQKFDFEINLNSTDDKYIYLNTNLFTTLEENPFKSDSRFTDIDFGFRSNFSFIGNYKIPNGYKVEFIPKNITLNLPDQSIVFKRVVGADNDLISLRYLIDHRNTTYRKVQFQDIRSFYQKMYELFSEQIVLKKI